MKRKVYILTSIILMMYVFGFFVITPVYMLVTNKQSLFMMNLVASTDQLLYVKWLDKLSNASLLNEIRNYNNIFWCGEFESCEIIPNQGKEINKI